MSLFQKKIEIDPVQQNLVNRIAPGAEFSGLFRSAGGLLIQGRATGAPMEITAGPLVVQAGGVLLGKVIVIGDCYIFGQAGDPNLPDGGLDLEVHGTVHAANTSKTYGAIACQNLATYVGCDLNSTLRTIQLPDVAPTA